jgi:ribosome-associated translation inhibitor RaiA
MQIQVNTDNHTEGSNALIGEVVKIVTDSLSRFGEWITRVEVQLSDENSGSKAFGEAKRCLMEARTAGLQPISVSHQGATMDQAVSGCIKKLTKMLNDIKEKQGNIKGNTSFAGDQSI